MLMKILHKIGRSLAEYLSRSKDDNVQVATTTPEKLAQSLRKGDVLLVDGSSTFSTAIKYLTQSSWSHAALFVGDDALPADNPTGKLKVLVEADIIDGVRGVELSMYAPFHTRICRPVGLSQNEIEKVVTFATSRLGNQYDLRNIVDLVRYLLPTPPVPSRFRRRLLSLGSGDPTRAICSSLIARAFQSIKYPILPETVLEEVNTASGLKCQRELLHIRHHSLFTPRDFDVSPYFRIIKPTLECGFNPHALHWSSK